MIKPRTMDDVPMTWDTADLDLDAYLSRTGATAEPPSLEALGRLQTAHVRTFPFENLDVLLEQHPGVSLAAVQDMFVRRHRGGYCFEHGTLFHAVLNELGYDVEPRLARVGDPLGSPWTHLVMVVTLDGRPLPLQADGDVLRVMASLTPEEIRIGAAHPFSRGSVSSRVILDGVTIHGAGSSYTIFTGKEVALDAPAPDGSVHTGDGFYGK
jgi:hypothetical protein